MDLKYILVSSLFLLVVILNLANAEKEEYNHVKAEVDKLLKQMEQEEQHGGEEEQHGGEEEQTPQPPTAAPVVPAAPEEEEQSAGKMRGF